MTEYHMVEFRNIIVFIFIPGIKEAEFTRGLSLNHSQIPIAEVRDFIPASSIASMRTCMLDRRTRVVSHISQAENARSTYRTRSVRSRSHTRLAESNGRNIEVNTIKQ